MCCIVTLALVLSSRIALFVWWLSDRQLFTLAFGNWPQPGWIWPLLGAIFLPWTTLAYLFVFPNSIAGFDWIILGVAFLIDLSGHGGSYRNRNRFSQSS